MFAPVVLAFASVVIWLSPAVAASPVKTPHVVVSIAPWHSLVTSLMKGVAEPELALPGQNAHEASLRPSDARRIAAADMLVFTSREFEHYLNAPLAKQKSTRLLELTKIPGMYLSGSDPHLWLDPRNARLAATFITAALIEQDPLHSSTYRQNAARLDRRLAALDAALETQLKPLQGVPARYATFHRAYALFEKRYGLPFSIYLVETPEAGLTPSTLRKVRNMAARKDLVCLLDEPGSGYEARIRAMGLRPVFIDPEGAGHPTGSELYFTLLREIAHAIAECGGING